MSGITEWLANLSWQTVVVVIIILVGLRYTLLKLGTPGARSVAEIAESLAIAMGLVFLIIRPFFVQAFFIPSPSMVPTLQVHDHILVNKTVYRIRDPKPGEIVVFKAPPEAMELSGSIARADGKQTDFIKRVVGVPGDEIYVVPGYVLVDGVRWDHDDLRNQLAGLDDMVRIKQDGVYVDQRRYDVDELAEKFGDNPKIELHPGYVVRNGKRLAEPYLAEDPDSAYPVAEPDPTDPGSFQSFKFTQKALSEDRLELIRDGGPLRVKLGKDEYLMMGDNRNNSSDGRYWGPLDRERVVGRAMFVFWPFGRLQWSR